MLLDAKTIDVKSTHAPEALLNHCTMTLNLKEMFRISDLQINF